MLRVISALVLLVVLLATIWLLPVWCTLALAAGAAALGAVEVAGFARVLGAAVPSGFVATAAAIVTIAIAAPAWPAWGADPGAITVVLLALVIATGAVALVLGPPAQTTLLAASTLVLAPAYVGLPLGVFAWVQLTWGPAATTWLLAVIAVSDSAQYYSGRSFGRTKLAPRVSPSKTVEGAIGGLVIVALTGWFTAPLALPSLTPAAGAALALALAAFGILGDLFESLLKRGVGVKDSSALIPGHGGVLDRIDSHLFAAPVFYVCMRYLA